MIIRGVSIVVAALVFFILMRHEQANQFMNEVMVELSRVSWPTRKETANATIIVIVMVVISGVVLGLLDYVWTQLLRQIL
jgi:preprotein translocase subunit SecE